MSDERLCGGFRSPWVYESAHELGGRTRHLWSCQHREGYTAYALTNQPADPRLDFVKPAGSGHYVGEDGLLNQTGIVAAHALRY